MYALDTNTLIYFFKGMGKVATNLLAVPPKNIHVPAVVIYELEVGIQKSSNPAPRRLQLDKFLSTCHFCPIDKKEIEAAATIRSMLEKRGESIGPIDNLIAGTAISRDLTLVTHNTREFQRIKNLKIVDWF